MKRAETYKKRFEAQGKELKELQAAYKELGEVRDSQRSTIQMLQADNNTLNYENGRQRARVDAMEYALVLAQAHAAPLQRREYDNRGWSVTATEKGMAAQLNRDQVKIAS